MSLLKIAIASLVVGLIGLTASAGPTKFTRERGGSSAGPGAGAQVEQTIAPAEVQPAKRSPWAQAQLAIAVAIQAQAFGPSAGYEYQPLTAGLTVQEVISNLDPALCGKYLTYLNFLYTHGTGRTNQTNFDHLNTLMLDVLGLEKSAMINSQIKFEAQAASGSSTGPVYQPLIQSLTMQDVESNLDSGSLSEYKRNLNSLYSHATGRTNLTNSEVNNLGLHVLQVEMSVITKLEEKWQAQAGAMPEVRGQAL